MGLLALIAGEMMKPHAGMTLGELAGRFKHVGGYTAPCKAPDKARSSKCAGKALGTGFRVGDRWVCAYCARKAACVADGVDCD